METLEQIRTRLLVRFPSAKLAVIPNPSPSGQHSLLIDAASAKEIAHFLRDDPLLRLDYCSNVTGIDWPEREVVDTVKTAVVMADGTTKTAEQKVKRIEPGFLEVVYHLYSMTCPQTGVILRLRTGDRKTNVTLPSLTPVWRSCEFQEREVFDLFGVVFEGHPDLRRILMWDDFKDHPMRKDYVEPDDYEWEPTAHNEVMAKAKRLRPVAAGGIKS
jgi:NADH-quinone oxidoreductase subunit C